MILSTEKSSLNKNGLELKTGRTPSKGLNHNKNNCPIYKCTHAGDLATYSPSILTNRKGNNPTPYIKTNTTRPKKIWVPNMKPEYILQVQFAAQSFNGCQIELCNANHILSSL